MQNIDFYENKNIRTIPPQYNINEQDYFQTNPPNSNQEQEKNKKRASRMILFITSLCIISFTVGIVIGIKFAGGAKHEIVDQKTFSAVTNISNRVTNLLKNDKPIKKIKDESERFPKNLYPYVIKIGDSHYNQNSKK